MATNRQFSMALQALTELKTETPVSASKPMPAPATAARTPPTCVKAYGLWSAHCATTSRTGSVRADGSELGSSAAAQLLRSNLRYFGYGFDVAPDADPGDGRLDAIPLDAPRRLPQ